MGKKQGKYVKGVSERGFIWRVLYAETRIFGDVEVGELCMFLDAIGVTKSVCAHSGLL